MRSRFVGRLAAGVALIALLAACSGEEGGPGAEKARYIEQSDAICRETFPKTSGLTARDQATAEKAAEEWLAASDRLKAMPQPAESVELSRQFVYDVENIHMSYVAAARALALNDQAKAERAYNDIAMLKERAAESADEYGYGDCAGIEQA